MAVSGNDYALPTHTLDFRRVFENASQRAIEEAIHHLRAQCPTAKRDAVLRPAAQRLRQKRAADLKRAGLTKHQSFAFADAEARWCQHLADLTGYEGIVESTVTVVRLCASGEINVTINAFATGDEALKIRESVGGVAHISAEWSNADLYPKSRGVTH